MCDVRRQSEWLSGGEIVFEIALILEITGLKKWRYLNIWDIARI